MKRHDTIDLWSYAARGLAPEEQKFAEEHLLDCLDCQTALVKVQAAQDVLGDARGAQPKLSMAKADAAIAAEVSRRLLKKARPVRWGLVFAPAAVAVAALAAVVASQWPASWSIPLPSLGGGQQVAVAPAAPAQVPTTTVVERAVDLKRTSGEGVALGGTVASGEAVSTGARGVGLLKLPDTSRLRLAAGSRLALTSTARETIALELQKGRVAVHAAHVPRKAFTVQTGDISVHVLGTTFAVTRASDWVEVAVSEGRVGVESPRGLPFFVNAGERVRVGLQSWRPTSRAIPAALRDELHEVSPATPAAGGPAPQPGRAAQSQAPAPVATGPALVPPPPPAFPLPPPLQGLDRSKLRPPTPEEVLRMAQALLDEEEWSMPMRSRAPVGLRGVAEPHGEQPAAVGAAPGPGAPAAALDDTVIPAVGGGAALPAEQQQQPQSAAPLSAAQPAQLVAAAPASGGQPAPTTAASAPAAPAAAAPQPAPASPAASAAPAPAAGNSPAPATAAPAAAFKDPAPHAPPPPPSALIVPAPAPAAAPAGAAAPSAAPAATNVPAPGAPAPDGTTSSLALQAATDAPAPAPAAVGAAPAAQPATESRGPMPEDLEELFLMRAERSLRNGGCDRYLLGLADIAEDPQRTLRQERARIAMARCQLKLGQVDAAMQELSRYVRDFPHGLFAREAKAGLAVQNAAAK